MPSSTTSPGSPGERGPLGPLPSLVREGGVPVHEQIRSWLLGLMSDGTLKPGDKLPAERALAEALGVSRMTLRQALDRLEHESRLTRSPGARGGAFVSSPASVDLADLSGLAAQLVRSRRTPGSRVLWAREVEAPRVVCEALGLEPGSTAYEVRRVRTSDGTPVVLEDSFFPPALVPGLLGHDLEGSIYRLLLEPYGIRVDVAEESISARACDAELAEALGLPLGAPVLSIVRTTRSTTGARVEFSRDVFRSDALNIRVASKI